MVKILRMFLISGWAFAFLPANSGLTGIVLDDRNQAVDFATIRSAKTQSWVLSDEKGFFIFPSTIHPGDSLIISRIGFKTAAKAIDNAHTVTIHLERDIIYLDAVNVEGVFSFGNADWKKESISHTDRMSRVSMLQSIPGSMIKTYGGKAGVTTLAIDGGKPEHTKIVLDGIDLTSPQNGLTDLSDVPKVFYQQVFLSKNPGIEFGSGAMDGVIHLRPWMNPSSLMFSLGSFGEENEAVAYTFPFSRTTLHLIGGHSKEKGDYAYSSGDSTANRNNNDFNQVFGGCQVRYLHDPNTVVQGLLFISNSDRGAAGSISYPSPSDRRTNELLLAKAKVMRIFSLGHVAANLSHRFNDEHYNDGSSDPSEHHVSSDKLSVNWTQKWTNKLSTVSSVSIRQESILKSTSFESRKRNHVEGNIVTNFSPLSLFSIRSGIRFDKSASQNTTYHIQCSVGLPFDGQLSAGKGTGYRLPTFNDLYWPEDAYTAGNTSLLPEESSIQSLGVDFPLIINGSIGMHWRSRNSTNLIKWAAGSDWIWRPENLDKTSRETVTISFTIPQWIHGFTVSGNVSKISTKDESTGKSLEYVPDQTAFIKVEYTRDFLSVDIQGHFTGERTYTGYDANFNSIDKTIDPISNVTLGIHAAIPWLQSAQCHFVINNVLDRDISFFPDYPEPGRSITAGVSINF